jgi:predicted PurR-regulated permease PerM
VGRSVWEDGFGRTAVRSGQVLLVIALLVVVTYAGVKLRIVLVPLLIAMMVASAANPAVDWLAGHRFPRALAVWTTLVSGLLVLGGIAWVVGSAVSDEWGDLRDQAGQGLTRLQEYLVEGPLGVTEQQLQQGRDWISEQAGGQGAREGAIAGATLAAEIVTGLFLGFVVLYFLLKDGSKMWAFLREQLPEQYRRRSDLVAERSVGVLGDYVRGTAIVALVDAVVIGVALALLGVSLALPLAVIVFFGAFVPLVGATTAGVLAALVALVSNGPTTALIVVVVVILVNQLEGDLLAPIVLGRSLSLHPLVILLALAAGTIVAGIVGAILAVPFVAVLWAAVETFRAASTPRGSSQAADGP